VIFKANHNHCAGGTSGLGGGVPLLSLITPNKCLLHSGFFPAAFK